MSSSVVPGCAAMKYGIRYCSFLEQLLEAVVRADARLHHLRQRPFADRFRRDLQIAADVMLDQFLHVLGRFDREVVAHARTDQHFANAR
jgi:hypothetical protein